MEKWHDDEFLFNFVLDAFSFLFAFILAFSRSSTFLFVFWLVNAEKLLKGDEKIVFSFVAFEFSRQLLFIVSIAGSHLRSLDPFKKEMNDVNGSDNSMGRQKVTEINTKTEHRAPTTQQKVVANAKETTTKRKMKFRIRPQQEVSIKNTPKLTEKSKNERMILLIKRTKTNVGKKRENKVFDCKKDQKKTLV